MKLWPLLLAGALLSGCVRFTPRPLSPVDSATRFEQRSLTDEALHRYAETNLQRTFPSWPPATWDLETLTMAAFYFSLDLAEARANYEAVCASQITAAQRPNPTVSVSPAYNTTTAIPSPWLVAATLDVPIETAGKRAYRRAQASHLADAARYTLASAAWDVRIRLRQVLLELWAAERSESLLREQEAAQATIVHLLENELAAGGIAPSEVSRERMALEQTKLAQLDAENRRAQARAQLAGVMGVPVSAFDGITFSFDAFEHPPAELPSLEARRRALLNRSDVLGALADYAASESGLELEIARQYPNLHLNPGYEFDQADDKWGVGLNFELPVLNRNRGAIAEAEARRYESAAKFNALQARVINEIDAALTGCRNASRKLRVATELLAQAQEQERAIETMVQAGELSRQSLAAARLETANIKLARLEALLKVQQAAAVLENALQLPLELPESLLLAPLKMNSQP